MTSTPGRATAIPFSRIKIRTGALVFCGDDVAFIRRDRAGSTHCTPPGGNVEHGEEFDTALARELSEELGRSGDPHVCLRSRARVSARPSGVGQALSWSFRWEGRAGCVL
ncbi:NUDIX domain-containing protein [Streptomyces sp. NPDC003314]